MFKLIVPIILIAVAVGLFVTFTNPLYREVVLLREGAKSYDEALDNSKALENERDKLTQKYNTIDPGNLAKLEKLLPENVDNIRLILEIEKIALPYGMGLKEVKYDTLEKEAGAAQPTAVTGGAAPVEPTNRNYGTWTLEFSTSGTYGNFLSFVRDLERNLRVVDISSVAFSSNISPAGPFSEIYQYRFKIKTYWLKN